MRIRISARLPVLVASAAALLAGCAQPWQQYQAGWTSRRSSHA